MKVCFALILFSSLHSEISFSFGTHKSGAGMFFEPDGIAIYKDEVYVADGNNHRVQVFDKEGNFLRLWSGLSKPTDLAIYEGEVFVLDNGVVVFDTEGNLRRKWGAFKLATGIAIADGEVYIAGNEKVQVFDTQGNSLRSWSAPGDQKGIALNQDTVFVASPTKGIVAFDRNGEPVATWGKGDEEEGLIWPNKMAVYNGLLYVVDTLYNRIQVYSPAGEFSRTIDTEYAPNGISIENDEIFITSQIDQTLVYDLEGTQLRKWGTSKTLEGEFYFPTDVVLSHGELFVVDSGNGRIQVFDQEGNFLRSWGSYGDDEGQLSSPIGLAIYKDEVFIADSANDRVQVFDRSGNFLRKWEGLSRPSSIALYDDEVFVTDSESIQVFDKMGNALRKWGVEAESLAVCHNRVYAGNAAKHQIKVFDINGQLVDEFQRDDLLPTSLTLHNGLLFISCVSCIQIFDPVGNFVAKVENSAFGYCFGAAVSENLIYIADSTKEQIHVFQN